jgi:hypothetical protein
VIQQIIADFFREWSPLRPIVEGRITHVPASPSNDDGKNDDDDGSFTIVAIGIVSALVLIIVSGIVCWMRWRKRRGGEAYSKELSQADVEGSDLDVTEVTPIQSTSDH